MERPIDLRATFQHNTEHPTPVWFEKTRHTRRGVEKDYQFYDSPEVVWTKINKDMWPYETDIDGLHLRDKALMCLLYLTCSRITEIVRGWVSSKGGEDRPRWSSHVGAVKKEQFSLTDEFLVLRKVRTIKHRRVNVGGRWVWATHADQYPDRKEIRMPLTGSLSKFTLPIVEYLDKLTPTQELFEISRNRAYAIIVKCSGETCHYLRDQGLKFRLRLYGMNIMMLKDFSGHIRTSALERYLMEAASEEQDRKMLSL